MKSITLALMVCAIALCGCSSKEDELAAKQLQEFNAAKAKKAEGQKRLSKNEGFDPLRK